MGDNGSLRELTRVDSSDTDLGGKSSERADKFQEKQLSVLQMMFKKSNSVTSFATGLHFRTNRQLNPSTSLDEVKPTKWLSTKTPMSGLGSSPETQNRISKANSSNDMLTKKKPSCQRIKDTLRSSDFCVSFRELSSTKKPVQHTPVSSPSLGLTTRDGIVTGAEGLELSEAETSDTLLEWLTVSDHSSKISSDRASKISSEVDDAYVSAANAVGGAADLKDLKDNFLLVCDSLGEQDIRNVSMGDTNDGIWTSLGKSLLSSKSRGDNYVLGSGTEVHLYELRDDIQEMCHTKPILDYRVQALHSCQLEDLYKRVMKNKAKNRTGNDSAPQTASSVENPLLLKNKSKQHGRI